MSNAIFPVLPGITWDTVKTPIFNTVTKKAVSGRETRVAYMAAPMYSFKLNFEFLRDKMSVQVPASPFDELKQLMGFFISRQGSFDSFCLRIQRTISQHLSSSGQATAQQQRFSLPEISGEEQVSLSRS